MASQHLRNRSILLRLAYKTVYVAFIYFYKDSSIMFSLDYNISIVLASLLFVKFPKCVLTPQPLHFLFSLPTNLLLQHFAHLAHFHSLRLSLNANSPEFLTVKGISAQYVVILYCISLWSICYGLDLADLFVYIISCLWFVAEYKFYVGRSWDLFIMCSV